MTLSARDAVVRALHLIKSDSPTLGDDLTQLLDSLDSVGTICKVDDERRMVYGWAAVATQGGEKLIDLQGDDWDINEMRETAHDFIGKRVLGRMHDVVKDIGEVRESLVLDEDLQKSLGVDLGVTGWFIGTYVKDETTWQAVKKGELRGFSVGGTGDRIPVVDKRAPTSLFQTELAKQALTDRREPTLFQKALDLVTPRTRFQKALDQVTKEQKRHPKGQANGGQFAPNAGGPGRLGRSASGGLSDRVFSGYRRAKRLEGALRTKGSTRPLSHRDARVASLVGRQYRQLAGLARRAGHQAAIKDFNIRAKRYENLALRARHSAEMDLARMRRRSS